MKYLKTIASLMLLILLASTACNKNFLPEDNQISGDEGLPYKLAATDPLVVSPDLIQSFYQYYLDHPYELSCLPNFSSAETINWHELTLFVYLAYLDEIDENVRNDGLSQEKFGEIVQRYFGKIDYLDASSPYLVYENGQYQCQNFDVSGVWYYRLKNIAKDSQNVYTASFDTLYFEETEMTELETSANTAAIYQYANSQPELSNEAWHQTIDEIFQRDDYQDILAINQTTTIQFIISDDKNPFIYLSCQKAKE